MFAFQLLSSQNLSATYNGIRNSDEADEEKRFYLEGQALELKRPNESWSEALARLHVRRKEVFSKVETLYEDFKAGKMSKAIKGSGYEATIEKFGKPLSEADLEAVEKRAGIRLPLDYRLYLTSFGPFVATFTERMLSGPCRGPFLWKKGVVTNQESDNTVPMDDPRRNFRQASYFDLDSPSDEELPSESAIEQEASLVDLSQGRLYISGGGTEYFEGIHVEYPEWRLVLNGPQRGRIWLSCSSGNDLIPPKAVVDFVQYVEVVVIPLLEVLAGKRPNRR